MKRFLNLLFCLLSFSAFSQTHSGLVLTYDLFHDEISYTRNNEQIKTPRVGVNENIKVVIKEFNPYITKAEISVDKINYAQSSGSAGYDEYGGNSAFSFDGISGLLGGFSMGQGLGDEYLGIPGSRSRQSQQVSQLKSTFKKLSSELAVVEEKINNSYEQLQLFKKAESSKKLALNDIENLKSNSNIKPSRIKELIEEEIQYAFAKRSDEKIDIDDLVDEMGKTQKIEKTLNNYQSAVNEYELIANKWDDFTQVIELINPDAADLQLNFIASSTDSISGELESNVDKFNKLNVSDLGVEENEGFDTGMIALRRTYEEIQSNNFTYSFSPIQAEGDEMKIDIQFYRKNELGEYESYKNLTQKIPVSGTWKISGGIGLSFGKFANQTYDYSIVENRIIANEKDDFIPIVVSFAHFYKNTASNINLGGSFGVGLPLLGGNSIQSASFFLGPTLIIGKQQRFLLTTGVMGAKTNRIADDYRAGDSFFDPIEVLPIKSRYELGYFIGISYNIINQ